MKLTIKTTDKVEHPVQLSGEEPTVGELRTEAKRALSAADLTVVHKGKVLTDDAKGLKAEGVEDGGMIVVIVKKPKLVRLPICLPPSPSRSGAVPA